MNASATDLENLRARDTAASGAAIDVRGMKKKYGALEAVRGISFEVQRGEIFGLIGADGAGKTTTFQILAGVMEATGGTAEIFGRPARDARSRTGYLTQSFSLYPDLTVTENIRYIGELRHVPAAEIGERAARYLKMFDMDRFSRRLAAQLSGGMKQKLALVCALVSEPDILLLDEPTTGVDPVSRREFWDTLAHLAGQGLTVLGATPYLDEAERCHRIALIHLGEIQQIGTPDEIRESLHAKRIELRAPDLRKALRAVSKVVGPESDIFDVQRFGDRLDLLSHSPEAAQRKMEEVMHAEGITIDSVRVDAHTLDNTFVATLRSLSQEMRDSPFPSRRDHKSKRGKIAIGAEHITKKFGSFTAVHDVSLQDRKS